MNGAIHGAVRRDLSRFATALTAFPVGDAQRAAQLGTAWRFFYGELTRHHLDEHAIAWPALLEVGVDAELLAQFDTEHDGMAAALSRADDAMAALQAAPSTASAATATDAIADLRAITEQHLDHEEAELEPVYHATRDTPEIKAMGRKFGRVSPPVAGNFFAWVQNGANAEEHAALRANVPGPVVTILAGVFGRPYRHKIAPVWRTAA